MTRERIEQLKALLAKATPKPWVAHFPMGVDCQWFDITDSDSKEEILSAETEPTEVMVHADGIEDLRKRVERRKADVNLVAELRNEAESLLALAEEALELREALEYAADDYSTLAREHDGRYTLWRASDFDGAYAFHGSTPLEAIQNARRGA